MHFPRRLSHDIAFEWTGRARRKADERVDVSLFHVSTGEPAFHVTGRFQRDRMTGHFEAVGLEFVLRFELEAPAWTTVHLDGERVFALDVTTGKIGTDREIGHWSRRTDSAVHVGGSEIARMTVGSGHTKRTPETRSARIYWGPPAWSDLDEVIRLAAIIIDTVFFVAPDARETYLMVFGGSDE